MFIILIFLLDFNSQFECSMHCLSTMVSTILALKILDLEGAMVQVVLFLAEATDSLEDLLWLLLNGHVGREGIFTR